MNIRTIAEEIKNLDAVQRFRLVADLLEAKKARAALSVARFATTELGAALCLLRPGPQDREEP